MLFERATGSMWIRPSCVGKHLLSLALADLYGSFESCNSLVRAARQQRKLPHAVQNRAAHAQSGVSAERNTARDVETPRSIEQTFAAGSDEIVEFDRTADG